MDAVSLLTANHPSLFRTLALHAPRMGGDHLREMQAYLPWHYTITSIIGTSNFQKATSFSIFIQSSLHCSQSTVFTTPNYSSQQSSLLAIKLPLASMSSIRLRIDSSDMNSQITKSIPVSQYYLMSYSHLECNLLHL